MKIHYIHFKHNLYGYAAIKPEDFEKLSLKDKFKINDILSTRLPFKMRVKNVNKLLKKKGLKNKLMIFSKGNYKYFENLLKDNIENTKGWMLAEKRV